MRQFGDKHTFNCGNFTHSISIICFHILLRTFSHLFLSMLIFVMFSMLLLSYSMPTDVNFSVQIN